MASEVYFTKNKAIPPLAGQDCKKFYEKIKNVVSSRVPCRWRISDWA